MKRRSRLVLLGYPVELRLHLELPHRLNAGGIKIARQKGFDFLNNLALREK